MKIRPAPPFVVAALGLYALLGFATGGLELFREGGPRLITGLTWKLAAVATLIMAVHSAFWPRAVSENKQILLFRYRKQVLGPLIAAVLGLLLLILSDWTLRRFIFYPAAIRRQDIALLTLVALAYTVVRRARGSLSLFSGPALLFASQAIITALFLRYADGRLIFSDDHPSFLYRLQLLRDHFPNVPFYNPQWDAGYSATEFFATGVFNVFFLGWPFVTLLSDIKTPGGAWAYTAMIAYLYIILVPWLTYVAARVLRLDKNAAGLAGLLVLAPTASLFEWLLKYGTLGFTLSCGLLPLTFALTWRVAIDRRPPRWSHVIALVLAALLCLSWGLSFLALVPLTLVALARLRSTFSFERRVKLLTCAGLLVIGVAPWFLAYRGEEKLGAVMSTSGAHGGEHAAASAPGELSPREAVAETPVKAAPAFSDRVARSHKRLKEGLVRFNPLVLIFGVVGIAFLRTRLMRGIFGSTLCWLFVLAAVGEHFKPQLELKRMIVIAAFLLTIPAAAAITKGLRLLTRSSLHGGRQVSRYAGSAAAALLLAAILLTPVSVGAAYLNRTIERYVFAPEYLPGFVQTAGAHAGNGRVFFLSFLLHDFGSTAFGAQDGGHVAPLAVFAGKPGYASYQYHRTTGRMDPIPDSFRSRGPEGVEEFLDLVNATVLVTFTQTWVDYCRARGLTEIGQFGRFRMFARPAAARGMVLEGDATVEELTDGLAVSPTSSRVVVKYRFHPKLSARLPAGVKIFPVDVFEQPVGPGVLRPVSFIGLEVDPALLPGKPRIILRF